MMTRPSLDENIFAIYCLTILSSFNKFNIATSLLKYSYPLIKTLAAYSILVLVSFTKYYICHINILSEYHYNHSQIIISS